MKKIGTFLTAVTFVFSASAVAEDLVSVYKLAVQNDPQFRPAQPQYSALLETQSQSCCIATPGSIGLCALH